MVLKRSKHGINSGCSFKFGRYLFFARYEKTYTCLISKLVCNLHIQPANHKELNERILKEANNIVQDGGLEHNCQNEKPRWRNETTTVYSLNKRKRWMLSTNVADAITVLNTNNIEDEDMDVLKKYRLTLVEREMEQTCYSSYGFYNPGIRLDLDVIAYHDSSLYTPHVYPNARNRYSYRTDLEAKGRKCPEKVPGEKTVKKKNPFHNKRVRPGQQRPFVRRIEEVEATVEKSIRVPEICYIISSHKPRLTPHPTCCDMTGHWDHGWKESKSRKKLKHMRNKIGFTMLGYTTKEMRLLHEVALWEEEQLEEDFDAIKKAVQKEQIQMYDDVKFAKVRASDSGVCMNGEAEDVMDEKQEFVIVTKDDCVRDLTDRNLTPSSVSCSSCDENEEYYLSLPSGDDDIILNSENEVFRKNHLEVSLLDAMISSKPGKRIKTYSPLKQKKSTAIPKCPSGKYVQKREKGTFIIETDPDFWAEFPVEAMYTEDKTTEDEEVVSYDEFVMNQVIVENLKTQVFNVEVESDSIHAKLLERECGEDYNEGYSDLRRFSIHISRTPEVYAVCRVLDPDDDAKVTKLSLSVLGDLTDDDFRALQYQLSSSACDNPQPLSCYISAMNDYLDYRPTASVQEETKRNIRWKKPFQYLQKINKWRVEPFTKDEAYEELKYEPIKTKKVKLKKLHSSSVVAMKGSDKEVYCEICFDLISCDGQVSFGTCLKSCGHWFCDDCWCCHLVARILQGDLALSCPGFECDTIVDVATLLSLVPYSFYVKHQHHLGDARIENCSHWEWCPRTSCGRAVYATKENSGKIRTRFAVQEAVTRIAPAVLESCICVGCSCGTIWCFDCRKEAHWPATCKQAELYMKQVKQKGDDNDYSAPSEIYFALTKKCPICRHPMEKNGGCQHMSCRCGHSFCWECLQNWTEHDWDKCLARHTKEQTIELDGSSDSAVWERYYNQAVAHRKARRTMCKSQIKSWQHFVVEWHFVMEWAYASLSVIPYRYNKEPNKRRMENLDFLIAYFKQKLRNPPDARTISSLQHLHDLGEQTIKQIGQSINKIQLRVADMEAKQKQNNHV